MKFNRFNRIYEILVIIDGEIYSIKNPIQITFEARKSIRGGLNTLSLNIFNLNEAKRLAIRKDAEEVKRIPIVFKAGYDNQLLRLFKGNAHTAQTTRNGVDFITNIECQDGGFDYLNSFTSRTVKNKNKAVDQILKDMPNTIKGLVRSFKNTIRPHVLVGNSSQLIEDLIDENENFYIDEEKLYIIKNDEVIGSFIPVVSPSTGLKNTPERQNKLVTFTTLLNPTIKIGNLVELRSATAKYLNGIYKVETITYNGDLEGENWNQECTCMLATGYKTL